MEPNSKIDGDFPNSTENLKNQKKGIKGMVRFFKNISKKEAKFMTRLTTKAVQLPKNFANQVLELELILESGQFDIDDVNTLMQLYSRAVEYYSGINDEKYLYFTERIQNMLVRPEILLKMKETQDQKTGGEPLNAIIKAKL